MNLTMQLSIDSLQGVLSTSQLPDEIFHLLLELFIYLCKIHVNEIVLFQKDF